MFHGFPMSSLVFRFFNMYAPPPMTSEIMNGPSHCGASLCTFSCISRRTRSPLWKVLVRRRLLRDVHRLSWYPSDLAMVVSLASSMVSLSSCSAYSASSSSYPEIRGAPNFKSCGSTASAPYTMKKVCTGLRCSGWCASSIVLRGVLLPSCLQLVRVVRGAVLLFLRILSRWLLHLAVGLRVRD